MGLLKKADRYLLRIVAVGEQLARLEAEMEQEVSKVRARYRKPVEYLQTALQVAEKELKLLMKNNKAALFDHVDQVDLVHGLLLYGEAEKVSIPRDAAAKIEHYGWEEALARIVKVRREIVEQWPEERLVVIGARRKTVEVYDYELKETGDNRPFDADADGGVHLPHAG